MSVVMKVIPLMIFWICSSLWPVDAQQEATTDPLPPVGPVYFDLNSDSQKAYWNFQLNPLPIVNDKLKEKRTRPFLKQSAESAQLLRRLYTKGRERHEALS